MRPARPWPATDPAPTDAEIDAALDNVGVSGPRRQDVRRQPRPRRRPTSRASLALWITVPDPGEVDHQPERDRGGELRQLRPVHPRQPGTTTARSSSSRIPNWYGDVKPTLTEIDMSMTTSRPRPRPPTRPASSTWSRPRPRTSSESRPIPVLGPQSSRLVPRPRHRPTRAPGNPRPARRPTRTSASR